MNVELLRTVKSIILSYPEQFDMGLYHCGTAHCIGGWIDVLAGEFLEGVGYAGAAEPYSRLKHAGVSLEEGMRLFHLSLWPAGFESAYRHAGPKNRAHIAAARIDHFIATDGRE